MNSTIDTRRRDGFSLAEMMISVSVAVLAITLAMTGFLYLLKSDISQEHQNELDIEVQAATERLKAHLRLSALNRMFFYPKDALKHTAISFPLARDDDGDGAIETDKDGDIIWDQTIVYHVWISTPNELRVTTFDPRDDTLSDAMRQAQLNSVVYHGHGKYSPNGKNAGTTKIFSNLFEWNIRPEGSVFDGYSDVMSREIGINMGSLVLEPGTHEISFNLIGKNQLATNYYIGVDSLIVSPCGTYREAEGQTVHSYYGTQPRVQEMPIGSWSGNYQMVLPSTIDKGQFTFAMANDRWEQTNFRETGARFDGTDSYYDETLSPHDFILTLEGNEDTWSAADQTGNSTGVTATADSLKGSVARVLVRGQDMLDGNWIENDGAAVRIKFRAGGGTASKLSIDSASIAECASTEAPTRDAVAGSFVPITFNNGNTSVEIANDTSKESDLIEFPIDKDKSYVVTYGVKSSSGWSTPWEWDSLNVPTAVQSYVWSPSSTNAVPANAVNIADWSSYTNAKITAYTAVLGVESIFGTYADEGTYVSRILNTQALIPKYNTLTMSAIQPAGTVIETKVRTAQNADMSDAPAWSNITAMTGSGLLAGLSAKPYLQFQTRLKSQDDGQIAPKVHSITIDWTGQPQMTQIGGTFTRGPGYGQFKLLVDGKPLKRGIVVDLELYRDIRGFDTQGKKRTITSAASMEIMPRNTGL